MVIAATGGTWNVLWEAMPLRWPSINYTHRGYGPWDARFPVGVAPLSSLIGSRCLLIEVGGMVLVVKGDEHSTRVYPPVGDVGDHVAVEHPRPRIGAEYFHIHRLPWSNVLGIDYNWGRQRIAI